MKRKSKALKKRVDDLYRERSLGPQLKNTPLFSGCSDVFIEAVKSNGMLSAMQERFVASIELPPEAAASDQFQDFVRLQLATAEKDLAHALELGRKSGVALPAAALVSQDMARIYRVIDEGRR